MHKTGIVQDGTYKHNKFASFRPCCVTFAVAADRDLGVTLSPGACLSFLAPSPSSHVAITLGLSRTIDNLSCVYFQACVLFSQMLEYACGIILGLEDMKESPFSFQERRP